MSRAWTVALLAVLASALAPPTVASAKPAHLKMLERVNAVRAQHGLRPFRSAPSLAHSANRYSGTMMRSGYFGHSSSIHASRRFRALGEIIEIHRGLRPAIGYTLRDWMGSAYHRSLILSNQFRYAGAGFTRGRFQGRRATIWVMHFGRR